MKKQLLQALASALLLLSACSNSTLGPSSSEDWFPLTVGNWWLYQYDGSSADGIDTLIYAGSIQKRVTGLIDHNDGFQLYELRSIADITTTEAGSSTTSVDTSFIYLRQTSEEFRLYYSTLSNQYDVLIKYPVTLNETWMLSDSFPGGYEVTDITALLHTPAGNFSNCAVITESWWQFLTREYSYHRGTGLVKRVHSSDYYDAVETLQSFNIQ